MRELLASWGLNGVYAPLHSLRHGGATADFLRGMPIEDIVARGRWQLSATAKRYIQVGRSLLLGHTVPTGIMTLGSALLASPDRLLVFFPFSGR